MAAIGSDERAPASSLELTLRAECLHKEGKYAEALDPFRLALHDLTVCKDHLRAALQQRGCEGGSPVATMPDETLDEEREVLRGLPVFRILLQSTEP